MTKNSLQIVKDLPNKTITVTRNFNATPEQVWKTWTESDLLDQWWAPKPWRTETSVLNFIEGGHWFYAMVGPDQSRQWVRVDFYTIDPFKSFTARDSFCDENGKLTNDPPGMNWRNEFHVLPGGTKLVVTISFDSEADFEKIVEMGIEEGFTSALGNLDGYFSSSLKMH